MATINLKINGKEHKIDGKFGPDMTLNEYIRTVADLRGTKVMCQEGGCGACIVAVRAPHPITNEMRLFAVNSCLVLILSCHGWEVTTIEMIGNRIIGYHELQERLANFNGTQCGFCSPGWIMSMYCLYENKNHQLTESEIENSFAGNICRCTGYRPIADAFKSFATDARSNLLSKVADLEDYGMFNMCGIRNKSIKCLERCDNDNDWCFLEKSNNKMIEIDCGSHRWYKAYSLKNIFDVISQSTDFKVIAGNSGSGVFHVTYPKHIVDISSVVDINGYAVDVNLIVGAGMSITEMVDVFIQISSTNEDFSYLKQFCDHIDLVAHIPVKNIGTIGGNLYLKHFNNQFQSDIFLLFETVGAMVTIADNIKIHRTMSLNDFLKTSMKRKVIVNVMLPPLSKFCSIATFKVMPRSQNSHAIVNAGFYFKFNESDGLVENANIVFGGISANFNHAYNTEAILKGLDLFTNETLFTALSCLSDEVIPEDMPTEPSASYRKNLAISLFYKAVLRLCPDNKFDIKYRSGGNMIKRSKSQGTQIFDTDKAVWPLNQPIPKLEGLFQCSGEAIYANDLPTQIDEVFAAFVTADVISGSIIEDFDASKALEQNGVLAFYSAKDIPGDNVFTPLIAPFQTDEEEIFCSKTVKFFGQPAGVIVANKRSLSDKAARLVTIKYSFISNQRPLLTIDDVINSVDSKNRITINEIIKPVDKGNDVVKVIKGEYNIGPQYHFTMEPQTCVTKPTEDGIEIYASTQWMDQCNIAVARCLNIPVNSINVIVRRVGGSYGAKINRTTQITCASALVTYRLGKTCRFVLNLETNMNVIGKRCSVNSQYEVGVNKDGVIQYLENKYLENNGCSNNDTASVMALSHFFSCYDTKRWYTEAGSVLTDTPSNTWCRAPGSTEGVAMVENIMEKIAYEMDLDPIEVRINNMRTEDNPLPKMIQQFKEDTAYKSRKDEIKIFNESNHWKKRAIKLLPMSYEIFHFGNFNAIVSIYHGDGTIAITHGGIEMGQGLNTKVAQVCAYSLGVSLDKISVKPSTSFTSPNAFVSSASITSECVSLATSKACEILVKRLEPIKNEMENPSWLKLIENAYAAGVDLQATYMYSDNDNLKNYDIFAVCIIEVEVDILTGNHDILRVDILEDTGRSLSPEIDVGQIEGSFVMGLGYWTSEKLTYDKNSGALLTNRTWTYKPPGIKDIPADMRIYFQRNSINPLGVLQSKATGEPAFCLAVSVTHAIREAVREARRDSGYQDDWVDIPHPFTTENIFMAVGHRIENFKLKS